ncbi:acyltransferase family protein [Nocardioides sp. GY 10113]|uniref:acyltransferase family protein n=1 Tax=Nocardioides sp. GY 10113 TaxID=2569761 RepID=UPI0014581D40|nr:acyltransferase family protein [Nocardioides sp. GY 10113]
MFARPATVGHVPPPGDVPTRRPGDLPYVPGLDGIRGLAVAGVLGFHLGWSGLAGGLLGVGVFFTLSGFLITRLLLSSYRRTGTLELRRFWLHRARRLLPALLLVLGVVLTATALAQPGTMGRRWAEARAAVLHVANWHAIASGTSYADRFAPPGPFDHLWSLSVEEQFYLIWPLLLLAVVVAFRWTRLEVAVLALLLAVVSFVLLAKLAHPGLDTTRAYEGTDTRAGALLLGAALAVAWPPLVRRLAVTGSLATGLLRATLDLAGLLALAGIGWLVLTTDQYAASLYSWRLLALGALTTVLVAAVAAPGSVMGVLLRARPLRWAGQRSYGIYLWHLPVLAWLAPGLALAPSPGRAMGVLALTLLLAEASWRTVEEPIRRRGLVGALREVRGWRLPPSWGRGVVPLPLVPSGVVALGVAGTVGLVACHAVAGAVPSALLAGQSAPAAARAAGGWPAGGSEGGAGDGGGADRTACRSVVYIGESTSLGLVDPAYLPRSASRLPARLQRVGVTDLDTDILGARSIVERWHDQPNAQDAVAARGDVDDDTCWVVAMGTNDAANLAVGGVYSARQRVDLLMEEIGDHPVLWLTVRSQLRSGPYADAHMVAFDRELVGACERHPTLRLYDWRAEVRPEWFVADGVHFTSEGYRQRARRIASALATAFPASGPAATGCRVAAGPA